MQNCRSPAESITIIIQPANLQAILYSEIFANRCNNKTKAHALINNAGEKSPYILVGHSFGGINIRMFEHAYPREVAGLILVDSASEESLNSRQWMSLWQPFENNTFPLKAARIMARLGIGRIISQDIFKDTNFHQLSARQLILICFQPKL